MIIIARNPALNRAWKKENWTPPGISPIGLQQAISGRWMHTL